MVLIIGINARASANRNNITADIRGIGARVKLRMVFTLTLTPSMYIIMSL